MARTVERLGGLARRLTESRFSFGIFCAIYAVLVLVIMMPALGASIGADDTYFTLAALGSADGSLLNAATGNLGDIFAPDTTGEQPRTVPLAITVRRMLAVAVVSGAVTFGVPIAVMWSLAKVLLLLITLASVAALLSQVRFRDGDGAGEIRGIRRSTITFILLAVPLVVALGVKAQSIGGLNGWVEYPVLTYGTVPVVFGTVALALWLLRKLESGFRRWFWPAVVLLSLVAVVLNYSYEFVSVTIPVAALAIALHPRSSRGWAGWKPTATVAGALLGVFSVLFVFNRWRLTTWPCVQDGSCYGGSVVEINPVTLWFNFVGALPSSITPTIESVVAETGRALPPPFTLWGVAIGLFAVLSLLAAHAASRARWRADAASAAPRIDESSDTRGLLVVIALAVLTAVGVSIVSGMTTRAIEWVRSPELPYRSGVAVWTCIALVLVIAVRMLLERLPQGGRRIVVVTAAAAAVVGLAHLLPLNLAVAQAERATAHTQIVDRIHWDVVLGDLTKNGDAARCEHSAAYTSVVGTSEYYTRTLIGADRAFEHLYGVPYCSTIDPAQEHTP